MQQMFSTDPVVAVWWGTEPECVSAVSRLERERALEPAAVETALERLDALKSAWHEIEPAPAVRALARRLLRVHPLSAADSLQLAACIVGSTQGASDLDLVTFDRQLQTAARREGIGIVELPS